VAGPDGRLWFTEFGAAKVGAVTTAGKVTEYALPTANAGPDGITVGPDGHVWFTEAGAGKIGTVNPATGAVADYPLLGNASQPLGIASGINGTLFISDNLNMSVDAMTISQVEGTAS
jgi:virginiamycin B lyase